MEPERAVDRQELAASIEARRELGPELEPQVVDSFVERIERRLSERPDARPTRTGESDHTLAIAIASLIAAIPITAIAATHGGIVAIAVVWAGIVLVNLAYARRPRRPRAQACFPRPHRRAPRAPSGLAPCRSSALLSAGCGLPHA